MHSWQRPLGLQTSVQNRVNYRKFFRASFSWVLNISKGGDSASTACTVWATHCSIWSHSQWKMFFLIFEWNFLYFSVCPLPLTLSLGANSKCHYRLTLWEELSCHLTYRAPLRILQWTVGTVVMCSSYILSGLHSFYNLYIKK